MVQIRQILKEKNNSKLQNLHDKFQREAKNIKKFSFIVSPFLSNM
jgi:hypothetical protein